MELAAIDLDLVAQMYTSSIKMSQQRGDRKAFLATEAQNSSIPASKVPAFLACVDCAAYCQYTECGLYGTAYVVVRSLYIQERAVSSR